MVTKTNYAVVLSGSPDPDCPDGSLVYQGKEIFTTSIKEVAEKFLTVLQSYPDPECNYHLATITWEQPD